MFLSYNNTLMFHIYREERVHVLSCFSYIPLHIPLHLYEMHFKTLHYYALTTH